MSPAVHRPSPFRALGAAALGLAALVGLAGAAGAAGAAPAAAPNRVAAFAEVHVLGRGINILGYDPLWSDPAKARFRAEDFAKIRAAGFQTVRVNLEAFSHMDAQDRLDPAWLKTLDWVVDTAARAGLTVIVDEHNYNECNKDPDGCRPRLLAFWRQVGARYRTRGDNVVFELLNEPNEKMTPAVWNAMAAQALAVVRQTNPTRMVVIGPGRSNNVHELSSLTLPEDDPNLIVTVHYYLPIEFTHQGAPWNPPTANLSGVTWGSDADRQRLAQDFDEVQQWARAHDRPILLGEFGAYEKADMASRVRYTSAIARAAEARGWAWAYWQFDPDFKAYDIAGDHWVEPIRQALIPDAAQVARR